MKRLILKILAVVAVVFALSFVVANKPEVAYAAKCGDVETSIIDCSGTDTSNGGGIFVVINIVLTVLTFGVGIAGTLGIIITGIMYLTARDNEAQMTKAKSRLINIVIGLAAYAFMWAFLQWLLPGGIFGGQ